MELPELHRRAVERLCDLLPLTAVDWALTGSVAHRIQGAEVACRDVDVQTDEEAAYEVARRLYRWTVDPVVIWESETKRALTSVVPSSMISASTSRSWERYKGDVGWAVVGTDRSSCPSPRSSRRFDAGARPTVLSLSYEADAYDAIGRAERAKLLRDLL